MYLRANTFFPTLFVSLLFIASTFAIPISPDSNSSPTLVDRDVVPLHARVNAPSASPPPYGSTAIATKPLEANVLFQGEQLSEEDFTALRSAIETMLKPVVWLFKSEIQASIPRDLSKYLSEINDIPVTTIDYGLRSRITAWTSDTEYEFDFTIASNVKQNLFSINGHPFHGTIARASLSNGGKLTGRIWALNQQTMKKDEIVSFTDGKAKPRSRLSHALTRYGLRRGGTSK
ncbi:hypothetical protein GGU11DRAFT_880123 [Lentinula aff. detonsa]|uniref:Uncharacterized protein n=1 Tax=Lentinula aff. detonsa TaxID=2804958 RepID=A0AA38KNN3_9AGAR|nr:hypothetical protein GGU10DRAFT_437588 [Lentinula aff. detonsa]KAJ3793998.1 hypothetical protein GGU11DRAFT_880123 [Lentinula aff. detonsa]